MAKLLRPGAGHRDQKQELLIADCVPKASRSAASLPGRSGEGFELPYYHFKIAFEMSTEFLLFWPKIRLGDFCNRKLWK
jgi:hypothetical protein